MYPGIIIQNIRTSSWKVWCRRVAFVNWSLQWGGCQDQADWSSALVWWILRLHRGRWFCVHGPLTDVQRVWDCSMYEKGCLVYLIRWRSLFIMRKRGKLSKLACILLQQRTALLQIDMGRKPHEIPILQQHLWKRLHRRVLREAQTEIQCYVPIRNSSWSLATSS